MDKINNLVVINGSPRPDNISNTYQALIAETEFLKEKNPEMKINYFKLPANLSGCRNCKECSLDCNIKDNFQEITEAIKDADVVMLGSPVYLDMPTPQMVAFLTRLNCKAENTNREFFRDKRAYLVATSFCSGTKTVLHTMMGACEMLGFTIEGRSTREYITLWQDNKLRGGMTRNDAIYVKKIGAKHA